MLSKNVAMLSKTLKCSAKHKYSANCNSVQQKRYNAQQNAKCSAKCNNAQHNAKMLSKTQ